MNLQNILKSKNDTPIEKISYTINLIDINNCKINDNNDYEIELNTKNFESEKLLIFNPQENYWTIEYLYWRLYCIKHNIKLTIIGNLNQFPILSLLADKIIMVKTDLINDIYKNNYINTPFERYHKGDPNPKSIPTPNEIFISDILKYLISSNIYMFKHCFNDFEKLNLPKNKTWVEMKNTHSDILKILSNLNNDNIIGINKMYQQSLLKRINHESFLSINILSSVLLNYRYICGGGSANLFSLMPLLNTILLADFQNYTHKWDIFKTQTNIKFFGIAPLILSYEKDEYNLKNKTSEIPNSMQINNLYNLQSLIDLNHDPLITLNIEEV